MGRVVVTGLGVVAPNGLGTEAYWAATLAGTGGIRPISRFEPGDYPVRLAGEITGFDPQRYLPSRLLPQTDHMTRLALVAADWALADARVEPGDLPEFDMGVVTASASGGFEFGQRELEKLWSRGPEYVSAYQSFAWFYAVNTGQISIRHGMRGPSGVLVSEQAGGLDALGHARRHVRRGVRLVVTGGVDSSLCPWGLTAQIPSGLLSTAADADRGYRPFAADAAGYVPGEGGAVLVLEDAADAARRGAPRVYATLAGYAATFDPRPDTGREPGLRRAVEGALADAELDPADIDAVFADGAGVPELDRIEAEALGKVFGPGGVPVTVPKSMTGRLYSGGAALDVAAAVLSIRDGVLPPTTGTARPDPAHGLDLVIGQPRPQAVSAVLVVARGHGGFNAAAVVTAPAGT